MIYLLRVSTSPDLTESLRSLSVTETRRVAFDELGQRGIREIESKTGRNVDAARLRVPVCLSRLAACLTLILLTTSSREIGFHQEPSIEFRGLPGSITVYKIRNVKR